MQRQKRENLKVISDFEKGAKRHKKNINPKICPDVGKKYYAKKTKPPKILSVILEKMIQLKARQTKQTKKIQQRQASWITNALKKRESFNLTRQEKEKGLEWQQPKRKKSKKKKRKKTIVTPKLSADV